MVGTICSHHPDSVLRVPQRCVRDLEHIKGACPFCFPELFTATLRGVSGPIDSISGTFTMPWSVHVDDRHLWPIYQMLANGVNVSLTLVKKDGAVFTYTIEERLGAGAEVWTP